MKQQNPLDALVRFCEGEWATALGNRLTAHTVPACEGAGINPAMLPERLGREVYAILFTAVIEDLMTRPEGPNGETVTSAFLKRHGWKLGRGAREHLQTVSTSTMALYEIIATRPDESLQLRDIVAAGDPIWLDHPTLAHALTPGCLLGVRIVTRAGAQGITGTVLPFDDGKQEEAAATLRDVAPADLPAAISNFWLKKTFDEDQGPVASNFNEEE
jgi:hypothetical protein